jgi:hypothetical protein
VFAVSTEGPYDIGADVHREVEPLQGREAEMLMLPTEKEREHERCRECAIAKERLMRRPYHRFVSSPVLFHRSTLPR